MPRASARHGKNMGSDGDCAALLRRWQSAAAPLDDCTARSLAGICTALKSAAIQATASTITADTEAAPAHDIQRTAAAFETELRRFRIAHRRSCLAFARSTAIHDPNNFSAQAVHDHILQTMQAHVFARLYAVYANAAASASAAALPQDSFAAALCAFIQSTPAANLAETAAQYDEALSVFAQRFPCFRQALHSVICAETAAHLQNHNGGNNDTQAYNRLLQRQHSMTAQVIDAFSLIPDAYKQLASPTDAACAEITKGIAETLEIKIDSLAESLETLSLEMDVLLNGFASDTSVAEIDWAALASDETRRVLSALLPLAKDSRRGAAAIQQALSECTRHPQILAYHEQQTRTRTRNTEAIHAKLTAYKKEQLLFECSTYEEILHYSVSRLRASAEVDTLAFIAVIDNCTAQLEGNLTRHGITLVKPAPHEPFNGREHEVLLAEAHDSFQKGTIVKSINSGYKENGIVLVRANVIAAK